MRGRKSDGAPYPIRNAAVSGCSDSMFSITKKKTLPTLGSLTMCKGYLFLFLFFPSEPLGDLKHHSTNNFQMLGPRKEGMETHYPGSWTRIICTPSGKRRLKYKAPHG